MPTRKIKLNENGHLPKAKDFVNPQKMTEDEKKSLEAFREAMNALKQEEIKYGKKTYL